MVENITPLWQPCEQIWPQLIGVFHWNSFGDTKRSLLWP